MNLKKILRFRKVKKFLNVLEDNDSEDSNVTRDGEEALEFVTSVGILESSPNHHPTLDKSDKEVFIKWTVNKCQDLDDVMKFICSQNIQGDLTAIDKALFIQFTIDNNFAELNQNELDELSRIFNTKSVVVLFMAKNYENFLIYWKLKDIDFFLTLKPFTKNTVTEYKEMYKFILDFLIHSLSEGHIGLHKDCPFHKTSNKIDICKLADTMNFNLLKLCAELGETEIVKILLDQDLISDEPNQPLNAQSIAFHKEHYNVLMTMLQANLTYPPKIDISKCPDDVKKFQRNGEEMHKAIKMKKLDRVGEILKRSPKQVHYFNLSNESASKTSLSKKSFEIYEILLANDVTFGPHEDFNEIFGRLSETERDIVRKIHFKYSKDLPENHMNILMMNTFISHDEFKKEDKEEYIRRAYKILDQDPRMSIILKTVAASKRFEIIFDFKRDSVQVVDATVDSNTKGSFYTSGRICIGAKQLLDPETEHEAFGTLAHELCHYAVNLTYKNVARPYLSSDLEAKEEFKEIVELCRLKSEDDVIIKHAYNSYSTSMLHAELIVRVPHLLALYHNNREKIKKVEDKFQCLFMYYTERVIPAMIEALPHIKTKAANEMAEKDKKIWNLRKKFYFSIILTFVVGAFIIFFSYDPVYEFKKLTDREKIRIGDSIVIYKNVDLKLRNLFNDNTIAYENLKSDQIKRILNGEILIFDELELVQFKEFLNFTWETLPDNLKTKIFDSNLTFQNQTVKFKDLRPGVFDSLNSEQIMTTLNGNLVSIGKGTKIDSEFYVKRKFILEDAKIIYYRSENPELQDEYDLEGPAQFYQHYMNKSFDERFKVFSEIRKSSFYKFHSQFYDLNKNDFQSMLKESNEIIKLVEKEKIFILFSAPGAGKTTAFQSFTVQIKEKFPTRWVAYIDLKEHTNLYKSSRNKSLEELLEEIVGLDRENDFEVRVFKELYKANEVVFLWNGYDEIALTYGWYVKNLIQSIRKTTNNTQYICTRTLYAEELSIYFKFSLWQLVPFTESEKREFLVKYLILRKVQVGDIDRNVEKFLEIIKILSNDGYSIKNFNSPLMLSVVVEVYEDPVMFDSINLYGFYDKFVQKKLELCLEKWEIFNRIIPNTLQAKKNYINEIFHKYGLLNGLGHFSSSTLNLKMKRLEIIQKKNPCQITYDKISQMKIVYINDENSFEFSHRTFAEFFIAQYFIENLYNAEDDDKIEDVELRLELFFLLTKRYNSYQKIITDFMFSYLENEKPENISKFSPTVIKLMKEKFNRILFNSLDADSPKVLDFFIKFFKKDHELLVDLLHVHKDETLYTAIFNPNYFASLINPEHVKNLTTSILTVDEFSKFTIGRNQKGIILYGVHFYSLINETKQNIAFDDEIKVLSNTSFYEFLVKVKTHLNVAEKKQLFLSAISPKIFLFYNKFFNHSIITEYERLWESYEDLLSSEETKDAIGYALSKYIEVFPFDKNKTLKEFFLSHLLKKAKRLNDSQIFEMYLANNFLHEVHSDVDLFGTLWDFLYNHSTKEQRREILLADDLDDHNYYFYWSQENTREAFSSMLYSCYFYDFTPFKILHRALSEIAFTTFSLTIEIYENHFKNAEIREIFYDSDYVLFYSIGTLDKEDFNKIAFYLERLFNGRERLLIDYLDREVKPIKIPISECIEDFEEEWPQTRLFDNLKVLRALRIKTSLKIP